MKLRACLGAVLLAGSGAWAQSGGQVAVYRCPGPPVLYTDALTAQEAKAKGCRTIEGAPVTVMQMAKPRPVQGTTGASRPEGKVDPTEQRTRDTDAKRILEAELRREEERLAELQREYNNGEPERRGEERNYQRYIERVAELKTSLARKEEDIAAIKRELAKLP
jgi:predicted RNase H-like nuclease (RuvC/YqgF family)